MLSRRSNHQPTSVDDTQARVRIDSRDLIGLRQAGEGLRLRVGRIAAQQSGNYLSRFKGRGMEFDEARRYQPGDDVRTLDWRVTARTGVAHTKLFREERERAVLSWVDLGPSMHFATQGAFKSVIAARLASLIAWAGNQQGDRLGGLIFNGDLHHELRPGRGRQAVMRLIHQLQAMDQQQDSAAPAPHSDAALARLRRVARPGSLIFLMSDFRHLGPQSESHLAQLARHNDVVLIHIYDPLEAELPISGDYRVSDGQRSAFFSASRSNRERYRQHFDEHCAHLRRLCRFPGIHYLGCRTDADLLTLLTNDLGLKPR